MPAGYPHAMGRISERLGEFDDNSVLYRVDEPDAETSAWKTAAWATSSAIGVLGALLLGNVLAEPHGEATANLVVLFGALLVVIIYMIWRRQRNKRLTGSATTWPTSSSRTDTDELTDRNAQSWERT